MGRKFDPQKLNPTPQETVLLEVAEGINVSLKSRAHLISIIDGLDLEKTSIDIKMVYVLAMLSLGFTKSRALNRLGVKDHQFYHWKQDEENETRLNQCQARGGLILEETLLLAAESDPKTALAVLSMKDKKEEKEEDIKRGKSKNVEDFFLEGLKNRGLIHNGEVVKEGPDELN